MRSTPSAAVVAIICMPASVLGIGLPPGLQEGSDTGGNWVVCAVLLLGGSAMEVTGAA